MKFSSYFAIILLCCYGTLAQEFLVNAFYDYQETTKGDVLYTWSEIRENETLDVKTITETLSEESDISNEIQDEGKNNVSSENPTEEPVKITTLFPDVSPGKGSTQAPVGDLTSVTSDIPDEQTNCTTRAPVIDEKIVGMNIGLYYVLEELRRKINDGHHPTELLIKALVISQKIERHHGGLISLNQDRMKVLSKAVPRSFKEAVCS